MKENGQMISLMEKAYIIIKMGLFMKAIGRMIDRMVLEKKNG